MGSLVPSTIGCSYHIYELSRCKMKVYIKKTFHQRFTLRPFRPDFEFELLLLGADGSGKSTFIRQMQLIHGPGFNDNDKVDLVPDVYDNIFDAMTVLARQIEEDRLDIPIEAPRWEDIETFRNSENPIPVRLEFLKDKFLNANLDRNGRRKKDIYSHQTTATDTDTMRFVFEVVKDTILRHNLKQYNLV